MKYLKVKNKKEVKIILYILLLQSSLRYSKLKRLTDKNESFSLRKVWSGFFSSIFQRRDKKKASYRKQNGHLAKQVKKAEKSFFKELTLIQ